MIERYINEMKHAEKLIQKKFVWRGLVNSLSQSVSSFVFAGAMYYGSCLIATKELHFKNVIKLVCFHLININNFFGFN